MRMILALLIAASCCPDRLAAQVAYSDYFSGGALRIDYYHVGKKDTTGATLDKIIALPYFSGNTSNLIDTLDLGMHLLGIYDQRSGKLIYSYGFSTLFQEWQTTAEAAEGKVKIMPETLVIPRPGNSFFMRLFQRGPTGKLDKLYFEEIIDPGSVAISHEIRPNEVRVTEIETKGPPEQQLDLALVAEGYSSAEHDKFIKDALRMVNKLFTVTPFKENYRKFNIYAVFKASVDSGTDDPVNAVFRNTALNTSFNTFGSQRYLMTTDTRSLHDIASAAPYDALYILVNSDQYGGGAIYNHYSCTTVDHKWSEFVFVHEFAHGFAALADEYFGDVAYLDFYSGAEPWEHNITAQTSRDSIKWRKWILPDTPVPTPWDVDGYHQLYSDYGAFRGQLRSQGASAAELDQAETEFNQRLRHFFDSQEYWGKVGLFEGGGYVLKGIYRPTIDSYMLSKIAESFNPPSEVLIRKVIQFRGR